MSTVQKQSHIAEIQLIYKTENTGTPALISSSEHAHNILRDSYNPDTIELYEEFKFLLLNRANHVLGIVPLATGTTSGCMIDLKFIVAAACKANASGVILCHNHPSGSLSASNADIRLTKKVKEIMDLLGITLLDHIILTTNSYTSLKDEGLF